MSLPIQIVRGDADEDTQASETPLSYLQRVVLNKLAAVAAKPEEIGNCAALLVADTIVRIEDRIIGKPCDRDDALTLLELLAGREHIVHTRYAIADRSDFMRPIVERTVTSRVVLRGAPRSLLKRYAATGEGLDKAGAYAVQGLGAFLVESINGSYTNVVGLPICEVVNDLMQVGLLEGFP